MLRPLSLRSPDAHSIHHRRKLKRSMSAESGVLWSVGVGLLTVVKIENLRLSLVCSFIGGNCYRPTQLDQSTMVRNSSGPASGAITAAR